jgi:hypothetical protein
LLLCAVYGCSNSTDPPAQTSGGEKLTGTVQAFSSASPALIAPAGIQITIQGTAFGATADTGGHFEIDNIPAGIYNIIFSKPGFDSMIYPVHHLIGVGTDIINDAYLMQESNDSVALSGISSVFTVSVSKHVQVFDTTITNDNGKLDTSWFGHDSTIITYDTVEDANAIILRGTLTGNLSPGNLFVYSSLDSSLWPASPSPQSPGMTEDAWLATKLADPAYLPGFESPKIINGVFVDTFSRDIGNLIPYSIPGGTPIYIYVIGHSNTNGLPSTNGEYQHFSTTPFGPRAVRFKFVVP